jgi:predicted P-loop ATPase
MTTEFNIAEMTPTVVGSNQKQPKKLIMKTKDGEKVTKKQSQLTLMDYKDVFKHIGYEFALNLLNDEIYVNKEPMTNVYFNVINGKLVSLGLTKRQDSKEKIYEIAFENRYNPIKVYLNGLIWDKQDSISLLSSHFEEKDNLFPNYFKKWVVGAVARIFEPTDNKALILNGKQNIGKSFFARWIGKACLNGQHFVSADLDPNDKDTLLRMTNRWVWEIEEMGGVAGKTSMGSIKSILTKEDVTERGAYKEFETNKRAITSFIGTFNNSSGFLNDPTGSRRFAVCTIEKINHEYSKKLNPDQVWAQAYELYKSKEFNWKFTKEEEIESETNNNKYTINDPLEDLINEIFVFDENQSILVNRFREKTESSGWKEPAAKFMRRANTYLKSKGVTVKSSHNIRTYVGIGLNPKY